MKQGNWSTEKNQPDILKIKEMVNQIEKKMPEIYIYGDICNITLYIHKTYKLHTDV